MIPSIDEILNEDFTEETIPSKTHEMHLDRNVISGFVDNIDSVRQMVYKILNTERYLYLAYSWDFGVYTIDLYGKPYDYVCSELQRRITEAIIQDDRVESVGDFEFKKTSKHSLLCTFNVTCVYGKFESEKVVTI